METHVQFRTQTKLFSAVGNDARQAPPNTLISHIDLGMPGALPVLNEKALQYAIRVAFALGTEPQHFSQFDRKHYFYPDLPMGYQITQFYNPIIRNGSVTIELDGQEKVVRIHEAHLEADAGKSIHPPGKDYSLVDLNRAGTPLLEIVSEPDMHGAAEAKIYARELYLRMKYIGVSDANLYYGNMRFDVNVSVSKDPNKLGTRSETKNLNSFKAVEKAVDYEINRQIELLEKGQPIVQETRGWDDAKQKTFSQRSKEEAYDYRYMPEPDLPPIELTEEMIKPVRENMPTLPHEWRQRLQKIGLDRSQIDTLLEAEVEDEHTRYLSLVEGAFGDLDHAKTLVNWMVNVEIPLRHEETPPHPMAQDDRNATYVAVYKLLKAGQLSSTNAKLLLQQIFGGGIHLDNIEKYAEEQGFIQVSDTAAIEAIVQKVVADNPKAAEDIQNGELKVIGFLVGQVMKQSQGKANPGLAQELIKKHLDTH